MPGVSPSTAAAVAAAAAAVPLREPKASVPIDYSRYVRKFSSAAECGNNHCRDLNYRCVTTKILYLQKLDADKKNPMANLVLCLVLQGAFPLSGLQLEGVREKGGDDPALQVAQEARRVFAARLHALLDHGRLLGQIHQLSTQPQADPLPLHQETRRRGEYTQ